MMTSIERPALQFQVQGSNILSPSRVAAALGISEIELADSLRVHRNVMRLHPEDAGVQRRLAPFVEVLDQLLQLRNDPVAAAFHMKCTPVRVLNFRTLYEVLKDGEAEHALRYLRSISGGQNG